MPKPRPLTPEQARRTLAAKFAGTKERPGVADRLRQLATRFGIRPLRVFLVWTQFTGDERGEGDEKELARVELLPTPKVSDLTSVSLNPYSAGVLPVGSIRLEGISAGRYTADDLMGRKVPGRAEPLEEPTDYFVEVVEDGRGDNPAQRQRYRVIGQPNRRAGFVDWTLLLERASEDRSRRGKSQLGVNADD